MSSSHPRILIVSQYFHPENFQINTLAIEFQKKGYEVDVLTGLPNYPEGNIYPGYSHRKGPYFEKWNHISIHRAPVFPRLQGRAWQLILNYLSFAFCASLWGLWKLKGKTYNQILVFQTSPITAALPAILLSKIKKAPLHLWIQDLWPDSLEAVGMVTNKKLLNVVAKGVQFIYKHSHKILIQSHCFLPSLLKNKVPKDKIFYLPNWAPDYYIVKEVFSHKQENSPAIITYAGNVGKGQNLDCLIPASQMLKEKVRWRIIGSGSYLAELKEKIQHHNCSQYFEFLPPVPSDKVPSAIQDSLALFVSLQNHPTFNQVIPSKVQAYMAMKKPILASISGEAARIISKAQCGLTSEPNDSQALIKNIQKLLSLTDKELNEYALNGQNYFMQHFNKTKVINQAEKLIFDIEREAS